jgi:GH15 family glucan-1,4-alpha-glucosidase
MVSNDRAIGWRCLPRFDGEPVFGRRVGGPAAGTFRVGPLLPATVVQCRYRNDGTTLETTWTVGQGRLVLTEAIVAQRELLIHVDPGAAWELIVEDEARWRTWSAQIDDRLP